MLARNASASPRQFSHVELSIQVRGVQGVGVGVRGVWRARNAGGSACFAVFNERTPCRILRNALHYSWRSSRALDYPFPLFALVPLSVTLSPSFSHTSVLLSTVAEGAHQTPNSQTGWLSVTAPGIREPRQWNNVAENCFFLNTLIENGARSALA